MTNRTTVCEVKAIRPTDENVEPMIAAANAVVSSMIISCGKTFTEAELATIELWLAAHFVGTIDPILVREQFENADNTFMVGNTNLKGVMSDKYGQTANILSRGCLADIGKQPAIANFL